MNEHAAPHEFIGEQTSASRAGEMIGRIRAAARQLTMVPRAGRKVQPENRDDLRVMRARPFWIYYRITAEAARLSGAGTTCGCPTRSAAGTSARY